MYLIFWMLKCLHDVQITCMFKKTVWNVTAGMKTANSSHCWVPNCAVEQAYSPPQVQFHALVLNVLLISVNV